jgi:hypothetical protein
MSHASFEHPEDDESQSGSNRGRDGGHGDDFDPAGADLSLPDLLRELEGSTHGGPRQIALFESLKRIVNDSPMWAFEQIERSPSSAKSMLLMAISGLGRRVLGEVLERLSDANPSHRQNAAMILCIWATRGLLCGADRESIEAARQSTPTGGPADQMVGEALSRLRT